MRNRTFDPKTARLRQLVADHGLSVADVCALTGRGTSIVHHWMSGKYKQIPNDTLELLIIKVEKLKTDSDTGA